MIEMNVFAIIIAALVPTIVGFIYYNPKTVGGPWMKASGMTEEKMKGGNMLVIFGSSLLLSVLMTMMVGQLAIHQTDLFSLFNGKEGMGVAGSEVQNAIDEILRLGGDNFRTFGHGMVHGAFTGIFLIFPIITTNNLFERKPFKLSVINSVYWIITLMLMGGILCQWL